MRRTYIHMRACCDRDSNQGSHGCEPSALPESYQTTCLRDAYYLPVVYMLWNIFAKPITKIAILITNYMKMTRPAKLCLKTNRCRHKMVISGHYRMVTSVRQDSLMKSEKTRTPAIESMIGVRAGISHRYNVIVRMMSSRWYYHPGCHFQKVYRLFPSGFLLKP